MASLFDTQRSEEESSGVLRSCSSLLLFCHSLCTKYHALLFLKATAALYISWANGLFISRSVWLRACPLPNKAKELFFVDQNKEGLYTDKGLGVILGYLRIVLQKKKWLWNQPTPTIVSMLFLIILAVLIGFFSLIFL